MGRRGGQPIVNNEQHRKRDNKNIQIKHRSTLRSENVVVESARWMFPSFELVLNHCDGWICWNCDILKNHAIIKRLWSSPGPAIWARQRGTGETTACPCSWPILNDALPHLTVLRFNWSISIDVAGEVLHSSLRRISFARVDVFDMITWIV